MGTLAKSPQLSVDPETPVKSRPGPHVPTSERPQPECRESKAAFGSAAQRAPCPLPRSQPPPGPGCKNLGLESENNQFSTVSLHTGT